MDADTAAWLARKYHLTEEMIDQTTAAQYDELCEMAVDLVQHFEDLPACQHGDKEALKAKEKAGNFADWILSHRP